MKIEKYFKENKDLNDFILDLLNKGVEENKIITEDFIDLFSTQLKLYFREYSVINSLFFVEQFRNKIILNIPKFRILFAIYKKPFYNLEDGLTKSVSTNTRKSNNTPFQNGDGFLKEEQEQESFDTLSNGKIDFNYSNNQEFEINTNYRQSNLNLANTSINKTLTNGMLKFMGDFTPLFYRTHSSKENTLISTNVKLLFRFCSKIENPKIILEQVLSKWTFSNVKDYLIINITKILKEKRLYGGFKVEDNLIKKYIETNLYFVIEDNALNWDELENKKIGDYKEELFYFGVNHCDLIPFPNIVEELKYD